MKEFFIRCDTYAEVDPKTGYIVAPETIEGPAYYAALEGKNYLNPDEYDYYGDFENYEAFLEDYYNRVADSIFCQQHDL